MCCRDLGDDSDDDRVDLTMSLTQWSVTIKATGDRPMTQDEIVELADAVIPYDGVASGIGSTTYGAQILVEAPSRDAAAEQATVLFAEAVSKAGLPDWPISELVAMSEADELAELEVTTGTDQTAD